MLDRLHSIHLKTKITGVVLLLFISSLWLLTYVVEKRLAQDMTELLESQQLSTVSYVAADLDNKIRQRIQLLNSNAQLITPELVANPEKAREFLSTRIGLLALYKAGVAIVSVDGKGITDYPPVPERTEASFSDMEFFREVISTGKPAIGKPSIGRFIKQPRVAIAAPINDPAGRLIGVLVGIATISDSTLFGQVENTKVGKSGYIVINVPKFGLIATSSNPAFILQPMAKPGVNTMLDKFVAGFEGSGIATNVQGVESLTSAKKIPSAGWIAQVVLPTEEAFAPVHAMKMRAYSIAAALSLFVLISVWLVIRQLLQPLTVASNKLKEMSSGDLTPLPVTCNDEIGQLLSNFNSLVQERNEAYEAVRDNEKRFRNILENAPIGMAVLSLEGAFSLVNHSLCALVGYEKDELERINFQDITHPDDLAADLSNIRHLLDGSTTSYQLEKRYLRKNGEIVWVQLTRFVQRDNGGAPLYFIAQIEDISERLRSQEQIKQLAYYDALTNLPNRRLLMDRLNHALAQAKRFKRSMAVMYLDLDNFKQINDTLGHDYGDELLKVVAERLLTCVRSVDTVCRQGGDEFIIALGEITNPQDSTIVAEKIIKVINEPVHIKGNMLQVTTSIGIAVYPGNSAAEAMELMKKADLAMYEVKKRGRNGFSVYKTSEVVNA
jgi:diguanylate cyclase (GGDEF)-like protein/PAS domain S-box-containing protein